MHAICHTRQNRAQRLVVISACAVCLYFISKIDCLHCGQLWRMPSERTFIPHPARDADNEPAPNANSARKITSGCHRPGLVLCLHCRRIWDMASHCVCAKKEGGNTQTRIIYAYKTYDECISSNESARRAQFVSTCVIVYDIRSIIARVFVDRYREAAHTHRMPEKHNFRFCFLLPKRSAQTLVGTIDCTVSVHDGCLCVCVCVGVARAERLCRLCLLCVCARPFIASHTYVCRARARVR